MSTLIIISNPIENIPGQTLKGLVQAHATRKTGKTIKACMAEELGAGTANVIASDTVLWPERDIILWPEKDPEGYRDAFHAINQAILQGKHITASVWTGDPEDRETGIGLEDVCSVIRQHGENPDIREVTQILEENRAKYGSNIYACAETVQDFTTMIPARSASLNIRDYVSYSIDLPKEKRIALRERVMGQLGEKPISKHQVQKLKEEWLQKVKDEEQKIQVTFSETGKDAIYNIRELNLPEDVLKTLMGHIQDYLVAIKGQSGHQEPKGPEKPEPPQELEGRFLLLVEAPDDMSHTQSARFQELIHAKYPHAEYTYLGPRWHKAITPNDAVSTITKTGVPAYCLHIGEPTEKFKEAISLLERKGLYPKILDPTPIPRETVGKLIRLATKTGDPCQKPGCGKGLEKLAENPGGEPIGFQETLYYISGYARTIHVASHGYLFKIRSVASQKPTLAEALAYIQEKTAYSLSPDKETRFVPGQGRNQPAKNRCIRLAVPGIHGI